MSDPHVLITGGAGFVGSNLADRLASRGRRVVILDAHARAGVDRNARWLVARHGDRVSPVVGDVRDAALVAELVEGADVVLHLAAQVAVTTSLEDPRHDFDVNALGTLHVLEAARAAARPPHVIFTSTNKVYGDLEDVRVELIDGRWTPADRSLATHGVSEARPLSFHSPYGCSKGCADQYVLDHARTFGLPATVFRMSCIYGQRQLGTEDQGWVAHFLRRSRERGPVTIFGDGRQVRDVLAIDDLVDAFERAIASPDAVVGRAFNLGGGPGRTLSLLQLLDAAEALHGHRTEVHVEDWRRADQRWFVADARAYGDATGWAPTTSVDEGLARLDAWLAELVRHAPTSQRRRRRPAPAPSLERA